MLEHQVGKQWILVPKKQGTQLLEDQHLKLHDVDVWCVLNHSDYSKEFAPLVDFSKAYFGHDQVRFMIYDHETEHIDFKAFDNTAGVEVIITFEPGVSRNVF